VRTEEFKNMEQENIFEEIPYLSVDVKEEIIEEVKSVLKIVGEE